MEFLLETPILEVIVSYIVEEAGILVPVLWVIGYSIKQLNVIKNKYIPVILILAGIILSLAYLGVSIESGFQGVLTAAVAVFGHQLLKQYKDREE